MTTRSLTHASRLTAALFAVVLPLGLGSAAGAAARPPAVTASASVNQFDATINYTINRKASYITSQVCLLTNTDTQQQSVSSCDATADKGSTGQLSKFAVSLHLTAAAHYSFEVTATVRDSGTPATNSAAFTVLAGPAAKLRVSGLFPQYGPAFASQLLTVEALDQYDNLATSYDGTVTFDGGDTTWSWTDSPEVLPGDSTLTGGRGVFSMNTGNLQSDCHYGDLPEASCAGYERVTATDTVNPTITGYQRFRPATVIPLANIFYTPDAGVCLSCVVDPSNSLQIDTSQPVTGTVTFIDLSTAQVTMLVSGTTVQGGRFTQTITTAALVGTSGTLVNTVVVPVVGQTVQVDALTVVGNLYGDMSFGNVSVHDPTLNSTLIITVTTRLTAFFPPLCTTFGNLLSGCA
ncbi:hypothetical protein ACVW00_000505 [Marmoricola sp. URHA0025 HA25]